MTIRQAAPADTSAIARIHTASIASLAFMPRLHTAQDDLWYITEILMPSSDVLVAEADGRIIGYCARAGDDLLQLHVDPLYRNAGAGSALLHASREGLDRISLWCFKANGDARRFYARHGFAAVAETDGTGNEEKLPDVQLVWQRHP